MRVAAMLAGMPGRDADELISVVPPKMGRATLRQIAVNAVMAGCKPEYEAANPWEPLHVERGFGRDQNVVTVVNAEAPHSMTENIQTKNKYLDIFQND